MIFMYFFLTVKIELLRVLRERDCACAKIAKKGGINAQRNELGEDSYPLKMSGFSGSCLYLNRKVDTT